MGTSCSCLAPNRPGPSGEPKEEPQVIKVVVQDAQKFIFKEFYVTGNKVDEIKFVLPCIKVTSPDNEEYLVYSPLEEQKKRQAAAERPLEEMNTVEMMRRSDEFHQSMFVRPGPPSFRSPSLRSLNINPRSATKAEPQPGPSGYRSRPGSLKLKSQPIDSDKSQPGPSGLQQRSLSGKSFNLDPKKLHDHLNKMQEESSEDVKKGIELAQLPSTLEPMDGWNPISQPETSIPLRSPSMISLKLPEEFDKLQDDPPEGFRPRSPSIRSLNVDRQGTELIGRPAKLEPLDPDNSQPGPSSPSMRSVKIDRSKLPEDLSELQEEPVEGFRPRSPSIRSFNVGGVRKATEIIRRPIKRPGEPITDEPQPIQRCPSIASLHIPGIPYSVARTSSSPQLLSPDSAQEIFEEQKKPEFALTQSPTKETPPKF